MLNCKVLVFFLFSFFVFFNQFSHLSFFRFSSYITIFVLTVFILFLIYKKELNKTILLYENIIFIPISLLLIAEYFTNKDILALKLSYYFTLIFLITNLNYNLKNIKTIFHIIFCLVLLLSVIGIIQMFNGGETNSAWDTMNFFYYGYRYLPSTRNEDLLIIALGYILSLIFIYMDDKKFIYFILNSFFSALIVISFARGYWLFYLITFFLFLVTAIFYDRRSVIFNFIKLYLLNITFILLFCSIITLTLKPDLGKLFLQKINATYSVLINKDLSIKSTSLERSSKKSLEQKINTFKEFKFIPKYKLVKKIEYFENSILFVISNYTVTSFLIFLFFFKEYYLLIFKNKNMKNSFFHIYFLSSFFYFNIIYNLIDDSTFFYFLSVYILSKKFYLKKHLI
jgi:hypothetical protein